MKSILNIYVFVLVIMVSLGGFTYADDVTIQLGSGDGFKVLDSSGASLMDILSNGKVGIGTSPNYKLDVSGDINFTGSLYQNGSAFSGSAWTASDSDVYFDSGNVGIGTTAPTNLLDVRGDGKFGAVTSDPSDYANGLTVAQPNSTATSLFLWKLGQASGHLGFRADATQTMYLVNSYATGLISDNTSYIALQANGNVGIGTTSPESVLDVNGNAEIRGQLIGGRNNTENNFHIDAYNGTGTRGIYLNYYTGTSVYLTGAALVTSDERMKKNIATLENSLDKIKTLRGVTFNWTDPNKDQSTQLGVIAQEVALQYPELVKDDGYGFLTVKYSSLIAPLISAIREMATVIDYPNVSTTQSAISIDTTGSVGIGTTSPSYKLDVAGSVCSNGTALTSDVRYKKDITPIKGALEKVNSLQGVSFNWRTDEYKNKNFTDKQNLGVIAQEVEKVVPEVVHTNQDGYKSVEYSKLVPLLIEGMKEQQLMIMEQQERISTLSAKVRLIEDRI